MKHDLPSSKNSLKMPKLCIYDKISADSNPFLMKSPIRINSNVVYPACVLEGMEAVFRKGKQLYDQYIKKRIVLGEESILNTPMSQNLLILPREAEKHIVENPVVSLKPEIATKIRDAISYRPYIAMTLFERDCTGLDQKH